MGNSLRRTLFVGILTSVVATSCLSGYLVYNWAYVEAIEMQDSILMQVSQVVGSQKEGATIVKHLDGVDSDNHALLVRQGDGPEAAKFSGLWKLPAGLQDTTIDGTLYRAFLSAYDSGARFAVLQQTSVREEISTGWAIRTVGPILALIPVLSLLIGLVVSRSFRPLILLGRQVDSRDADDLDPLPLSGASIELQPFLSSLNQLFKRVEELINAQRRMIADAAHELRTPITALSIQAENLNSTDLPEDTRRRVEALKAGAIRTRHLLEQLLALARQESGISMDEVIEVGQVARKVIGNLIDFANVKDIDMDFEQSEPTYIRSETITIEILIRNLLDNAIKYTPKGGRVSVRLAIADQSCVLSVEDSGPGLTDVEMETVFNPFVRGQDIDVGGSGLGLSIVKRITEQLDGSVNIQNKKNRNGAIVTVTIPIARDFIAPIAV